MVTRSRAVQQFGLFGVKGIHCLPLRWPRQGSPSTHTVLCFYDFSTTGTHLFTCQQDCVTLGVIGVSEVDLVGQGASLAPPPTPPCHKSDLWGTAPSCLPFTISFALRTHVYHPQPLCYQPPQHSAGKVMKAPSSPCWALPAVP